MSDKLTIDDLWVLIQILKSRLEDRDEIMRRNSKNIYNVKAVLKSLVGEKNPFTHLTMAILFCHPEMKEKYNMDSVIEQMKELDKQLETADGRFDFHLEKELDEEQFKEYGIGKSRLEDLWKPAIDGSPNAYDSKDKFYEDYPKGLFKRKSFEDKFKNKER